MKYKHTLAMIMTAIIVFITACSTSEPAIITPDVEVSSGQVTENVSVEPAQKVQEEAIIIEESIPIDSDSLKTYTTLESLNLREGPSTDDTILTIIPKGQQVTMISETDMWMEVSYGGNTGFVSSDYLTDQDSTVTPIETTVTPEHSDPTEGFDVPILMYHAIDEFKGNGIQELYVTPANFESQMRHLKSAGFTPISFDDFNSLQDISKPILITFDDGYKNNMNAYHVLKKLNSPSFQAKATIFMIGKKIDTSSGLSTSQLKEMSDSGIISIQSHTETHPSLPTITNFEDELGGIKDKIETITGKKVTAIAYPSGQYDSNVIAESEKYYDYAVTTKPGIANTNDSPYEMKRVRINYSTTLSAFESLVNQ
jgi:peptidoglycan/xylan/chitin deacetylase (PgdA/CDA1 family)